MKTTLDFLIRFLKNLLLGNYHELSNREMHIQLEKAHFDRSKNSRALKKSSEKSSEKIKKLIAEMPVITIKELAQALRISERAVEKNIAKLKSEGILVRIGADKGGYWKIVDN